MATQQKDFYEILGVPRTATAEEIKKDAFFYLLTLRLIPVMPFWLTNVAAGLIAIRVSTFAAATLIGIFPVAAIYAGVGSGLGSLFDSGQPLSLHAVITPKVLLPLAGLAVLSALPIVYQRWRGRKGPDAQRGMNAETGTSA